MDVQDKVVYLLKVDVVWLMSGFEIECLERMAILCYKRMQKQSCPLTRPIFDAFATKRLEGSFIMRDIRTV